MYHGNENGGEQPEDWVKDYREKGFHTESILDGLVTGTEKIIEEVKSGLWYTPSDLTLPYAESGWARKEAAQREGEHRLEELRSALRVIEKELARCRKNYETIRHGRGALSSEPVLSSYGEAEMKQRDRLRLVENQKQRLIDSMRRLEAVLVQSRAKKYPGKGRPKDALDAPINLPRQGLPAYPPTPFPPSMPGVPSEGPRPASPPPPPALDAWKGIDRPLPRGPITPGIFE